MLVKSVYTVKGRKVCPLPANKKTQPSKICSSSLLESASQKAKRQKQKSRRLPVASAQQLLSGQNRRPLWGPSRVFLKPLKGLFCLFHIWGARQIIFPVSYSVYPKTRKGSCGDHSSTTNCQSPARAARAAALAGHGMPGRGARLNQH